MEACEKNGITFIGPSKELMERMGDKISSKQMAIECDVPIIPVSITALKSEKAVLDAAHKIGYPVMLKHPTEAVGRGMRIVRDEEQLIKEYREARESLRKRSATIRFPGKISEKPKHIEVQILADNYGNVVHLFDRDCSVQRRHQKVVEFAPAFTIPESTRQIIFDSAVRLAGKVGYRNAGTLEFLVDKDNHPYFIEMNRGFRWSTPSRRW